MATLTNFLSTKFLENTLKLYLKEDIVVQNFYTKKLNTGFCSILQSISVSYCSVEGGESQQLSIISKSPPESETVVLYVTVMKCFEIERGVYKDILPAIDNFDYRQKLAPKLLGELSQPKYAMVLENLITLNYKSFRSNDRLLDLSHCLVVIEKLAYLHAASVALHEKDPTVFKEYNQGLFSHKEIADHSISITVASLISLCKKTPDLRVYQNKFCIEAFTEAVQLSRQRSPNFNVLNHGDVSVDNLMFYYGADKNVADMLFLDFQFSFFSSPVLDLHNFWACCTNTSVKLDHLDHVLNHYHNELVKNLLKLKVITPPPTMEELREEFRTRAVFGFVSALFVLPAKIQRKEHHSVDIENYLTDDGEDCLRNICFRDPEFMKHLKLLLPFYEGLGVFS